MKPWLIAAVVFLLSSGYLWYLHNDLAIEAHDRVLCDAARQQDIRDQKYPHRNDAGMPGQFCERLATEAIICRYAAIASGLAFGYCVYRAAVAKVKA